LIRLHLSAKNESTDFGEETREELPTQVIISSIEKRSDHKKNGRELTSHDDDRRVDVWHASYPYRRIKRREKGKWQTPIGTVKGGLRQKGSPEWQRETNGLGTPANANKV